MEEYLQGIFGVKAPLRPFRDAVQKLPLYLRGNYDLYASQLAGQQIIWAEIKSPDRITPDQLKKQSQVLQDYLGQVPVVYIFDKLETWERKRLIEKKIGFAEPFRQLYIPQLFTQIREGGRKEMPHMPASKKIKPPTQFLLLYHLQVAGLEEKLFKEIALLMNYSAMTVTRSIKELAAANLVIIEGNSKQKKIRFSERGRALWDKALPYLSSPVRDTWFIDRPEKNEYTRYSGETALAHYSNLSKSEGVTLAIGKDSFRLNRKNFKEMNKRFGPHKIEVWHYDPIGLTDSDFADSLSVYLTLKDHEDERVQGELEELLNNKKWLKD